MPLPEKQLISTWASKKEICFRLFSCLAPPCQKCKITKQLMAPCSRCPGTVDNPTNKPDLAYCTASVFKIPLYFSGETKTVALSTAPPSLPTPAVSCQPPNLTRNLSTNIFLAKSRSTPRGLTNWFRLNDRKSPRCGLLDYNLTYLRFGFSAAWHL